MKLSGKPTQRLSDLPKGTQLGVETGVEGSLPTNFLHKMVGLNSHLEQKLTLGLLQNVLHAVVKD